MAECQHFSFGSEDLYTSMGNQLKEIIKDSKSIKGPFTRYILNTATVIDAERLKRKTFGEKVEGKPHKTILMVGETGTGKSTLINVFVNYILGVQQENKIWCEIIETKENQPDSQTNTVTVYDIFSDQSPFSITVIDTPGFGSTKGAESDLKIAESLHELFRSKDGVHEIDAVCLVVSANTTRLADTQLYVFDAVLSLFGVDVEKNIVVLITRAHMKPKNALKAIKASKVKCAKTPNGKPVHFCFDNSLCEQLPVDDDNDDSDDDEDDDEKYKNQWEKNKKSMMSFFEFLSNASPINVKLTEHVLRKREQLKASISNLEQGITLIELRKTELDQTKAALKQHEKEKKNKKDFECEVDEPYKEKVLIESEWWYLSKEATCCRVCEENCHYPGCWWVRDLSWCSVMSNDGKCTVCTGRCDYTEHVKEEKIYVLKTRKVKKTYEDLKRKYEEETGEKRSLISRLENEIQNQEKEKYRLVEKSYQCVISLEEIALNPTAVSTHLHLDFLIEKIMETGNEERVKKLKKLKKRAEEENPGRLGRMKQWWCSV